MHPDQIQLTVRTVKALVEDQFPQWRELAVHPVASHGTVNHLFRLGEGLVLRFPLEPGDAGEKKARLRAEAAAARRLLGQVPVPTPEPVAVADRPTDTGIPPGRGEFAQARIMTRGGRARPSQG